MTTPAQLPEHLYRQCFRDSTDTIVITDRDGRIVDVNPAWESLYGYSREEVLGQTTRILRSEHTDTEMLRYMWKQIADSSQGYWKGEIVNRARSGKEIPVLLTITPVRHDAQIVGYMGIGIDLSAQKEYEEFKRLYDMVIRHDLKSPLASIQSIARALSDGYFGEVPSKQREMLERLHAQAERMQAMIATSLDLEKLKVAKLHFDVEQVDILPLLRTSIQALAASIHRKGLTVHLKLGDSLARSDQSCVRTIDPLHLQRCTDNLLKNAVEAAPDSSEVTISVDEVSGEWTIRVHNEGAPIAPDLRATLFHPFSTYGKRGGNGLGIYGVKMTVEAMGGRIHYDSTAEGGTTFELAFPLATP